MEHRFWGRSGVGPFLALTLSLPLSLAAAGSKAASPAPTAAPTAATSPIPSAAPTAQEGPQAYTSSSKDKSAAAGVSKTGQAAAAKTTPAKTATPAASTEGHRSPTLAGVLAFVPGVAFHGAGHMYAGSWMKGLGLLALEGGAAYALAVNGQNLSSDIDTIKNSTNNGGIPTDISGAETHVGVCLVATAAFLFSWWDDMAGAPIAANEYNRLVDENRASLGLQPIQGGAVLALNTRF